MTTIWERVESALTPLAIPMAAKRFMVDSGQSYPDTYLVYFIFSIDPELFADDEEKSRSEAAQVSIYNKSGSAGLPDVIGAMKAGGFTFTGGRELDDDPDSEYFGIAFDFEYLEDL